MNLRRFQVQVRSIFERIKGGEQIDRLLLHVTQGGGKSSIPAIASGVLGDEYKICWVVPRNTLREQGVDDFADPAKQRMYGNSGELRSAGNEIDPSRGSRGYVTTYQAICHVPDLHAEEMRNHRYILILDEFNHIGEEGAVEEARPERSTTRLSRRSLAEGKNAAFYAAIAPLVERAKIVVFMSGTMMRNNNERIGLVPYLEFPGEKGKSLYATVRKVNHLAEEGQESEFVVDDQRWVAITYTRKDAIAERAILPIEFTFIDGSVTWTSRKDNQEHTISSLGKALHDQQYDVLYTLLRTELGKSILLAAVVSWRDYRDVCHDAKLLVIAPTIEVARTYHALLREHGVTAMIATSDDSAQALRHIAHYRGDMLPVCDALVTVAMCYEGLNVPQITHVACLTEYRSIPWIEQAVSRANRTNYGNPAKGQGFVFIPNDRRMKVAMEWIANDYPARVVIGDTPDEAELVEAELVEAELVGLDRPIPGGSAPGGYERFVLNGVDWVPIRTAQGARFMRSYEQATVGQQRIEQIVGMPMTAEQIAELASVFASSTPSASDSTELVEVSGAEGRRPEPAEGTPPAGISDREKNLRSQIRQKIARTASGDPRTIMDIYQQISVRFGKPSRDMTEGELASVIGWLES